MTAVEFIVVRGAKRILAMTIHKSQNRPLPLMKQFALLALSAAALMNFDSSAAEPPAADKPKRNVDGFMDNSFLIEEAYNQEPGVVQHIFGAFYGVDKLKGPDDKSLLMAFTQEWPLFSQAHQFSYTVPYTFARSGGQSSDGTGDVQLNYRYQANFNKDTLTAFAPRVSLVLPTGDEPKGFGDNSWGYQFNLPFSTTLADKWCAHANAGLTFLPNAGAPPRNDLLHYNLGASVIYAAKPDLHFMLEWISSWNEGLSDSGGLRREFASIISPGVRKAFNYANDSQLVLGLAAPIGLTGPAPDFGVFLYVSFEHFFKRQK